MDALEQEDKLPRTILYSLDAGDKSFLDTLIGAFQGTEIAGKLQHSSAWWFNDNKQGMQDQLISLANLSLLGTLIPTQVFAAQMVGREGCNILNVSSMKPIPPWPRSPLIPAPKPPSPISLNGWRCIFPR